MSWKIKAWKKVEHLKQKHLEWKDWKRKAFRQDDRKYGACLMLGAMMMLTTGFTTDDIHHVRILVDGKAIETHSVSDSPERILDYAGIRLNEQDEFYSTSEGNQTEITVYRAQPITIEYKGTRKEALTTKQHVGEALSDLGYNVNDYTVVPGLGTKIEENIVIQLEDSAAVKAAEAARKAEEERRRSQQIETSRGLARYASVMTMEATAYLPTDGSSSGSTATGIAAERGIVAVDPNVIPLGTRVYIPGYGEALAADTGGAIRGNKIDLCMEDYSEAMAFGRRDVTVYVLQ